VGINVRNENEGFLELLKRGLEKRSIKAKLVPGEEGRVTNLGVFRRTLYVLAVSRRYHCPHVLRRIKDKLQLPHERAPAKLALQHASKGYSMY